MIGREARLGRTDGFEYIGFRPGLTPEEMEALPRIESVSGYVPIVNREQHTDGTSTIGIESWPFHSSDDILRGDWDGELETQRFLAEAERLAVALGVTRFDSTIRATGSGSLFEKREP